MARPSAEDPYLDYYGFAHDPFGARMPGFKFFPTRRKQVLSELHQRARQNAALLVVSGPLGSGKTLLRQALVATTNKQSIQSIVITPQAREAGGVLGRIAKTLGCPWSTPHAILTHAGQLALRGQSLYLLVDDAHVLSDEELLDLLTLAIGDADARLTVFLFGESLLAERLEALLPASDSCHIIPLQPYTEAETTAYLAQRLEAAGSSLDCLSPEQIHQIQQRSEGWPGRINQAARDTLVQASTVVQRTKKPHRLIPKANNNWTTRIPWLHVLGIVAVLAAILGSLLFQTEDSAPQNSASETPKEQATQDPALEINGNGQRLPLPLNAEDEPLVREPIAAAAGGESERLAPASQSAKIPAPHPTAGTKPPHPSPKAQTPAPAKTEQLRPSTTPTHKPSADAARPAAGFAGWYLKQPTTHYLLQVLGTRSEQTAQHVLSLYGKQYRYFVKLHQGEPLYVVTYGSFKDRQTALEATPSLPAQLQTGPPWARSFASVQQEIQQVR